MPVKCGRGHKHDTIGDVQSCYNGEDVEDVSMAAPVSALFDGEPKATDKQIAFVCSLADQKLPPAVASVVKKDAAEGHWGKRSISTEINRLKGLPKLPVDRSEEAEFAAFGREQTSEYLGGQESHATAQTPGDLDAGMYRMGEDVYKVQVAVHGSGRPYAKRLAATEYCGECGRESWNHSETNNHEFKTEWKFDYAPGAIQQLKPEMRMTLEEAKEFGAIYGICCVCAAILTNEKSIEEGIGPVCGGRV